ncbi:general secretion pathway protein GspB [Geomonas subterranea]|uniref:General secretion pathway protein GspB n=1 Tax=Geomonas subterranea TaxID=2847989 RepID=A0ABX8LJK0_9BACT|nr:general secretion pathway protein GspB [Geomonas subterranea]QXE91066.1 general secretion pathway protein GspB [Geomonas subterranea]QXM10848.1 general secretion pathway protein GspB [Geomonas subterranea]
MSLILDALRKMEQERRSRRGSAQNLRPEVLRYRLAAQPKEPRRFPVAVIAGVVLLLAGVGAGFLLKGHAPQPAAEATLAPPTPVAAAPSAAPAVTVPPAATVAPPVPADVPVPAPAVAPAVADKAPAAVPQPVVPPARKSSRAAAAQFAPSAPPQSAAQEPAAAAGAPQDITISGIAYQDERRMRRAVLNGILVGEGAEVGGARVLEIKETKVKLSRGGRVFEVPFSSGLQSR